jgi:hypothetical protein
MWVSGFEFYCLISWGQLDCCFYLWRDSGAFCLSLIAILKSILMFFQMLSDYSLLSEYM